MTPCFAAALVVPTALAVVDAQTQVFTAPPGFLQTEGPMAAQFNHPFYNAVARFQYVDAGQRGLARPGIKRLELRRDGMQISSSPTRTVELEVVMAETDAGTQSTTFASNYVTGPVTVFVKKSLTLPDHTQIPVAVPAPFDVQVPFDAPFAFTGALDLLWELRLHANSASGSAYSLDTVDSTVPGEGQYTYLGFQSCTTALGPYWVHGVLPRTTSAGIATIGAWAEHAPSSTPTVLAIGFADWGFASYLCAPLRSSAEVMIPVVSDATGHVGGVLAPVGITFPLAKPLDLYLQFASFDPAQAPNLQVALSDAVRYNVVPYFPVLKVSRLFSLTSATASVGALVSNTMPIVRFTY